MCIWPTVSYFEKPRRKCPVRPGSAALLWGAVQLACIPPLSEAWPIETRRKKGGRKRQLLFTTVLDFYGPRRSRLAPDAPSGYDRGEKKQVEAALLVPTIPTKGVFFSLKDAASRWCVGVGLAIDGQLRWNSLFTADISFFKWGFARWLMTATPNKDRKAATSPSTRAGYIFTRLSIKHAVRIMPIAGFSRRRPCGQTGPV